MTLAEDKTKVQALVGKTITAADAEPSGDGGDYAGSFFLSFEDGTIAEFFGWGHDWWGCDVSVGQVKS